MNKQNNPNIFSETSEGVPPTPSFSERKHASKIKISRRATILIFLILVVTFSVLTVNSRANTWRAVFLTNNQAYFGQFVYWPFTSTITLRNVYYLQTGGANPSSTLPAVNLIRLGNEMHAPQNFMVIQKNQIMFFEDLRADGAVVAAIENYEAKH